MNPEKSYPKKENSRFLEEAYKMENPRTVQENELENEMEN